MNKPFSQTNSLTVLRTTDLLELADSLNSDGSELDNKLFSHPHLVVLRSIEVLDLAAGIKMDGWSWTDITNRSAA
jgi:hypothetical protein